jgi:putative spermidine/putrescine transport system permease protein
LLVILGDNGFINATLLDAGLLSSPLPLMYNQLGIVLGLATVTIPIMVLALIGVIRRVDPTLEEAARTLGARGGSQVLVLPMVVYSQIQGSSAWQFAAAVSVVMLVMSLGILVAYNRAVERGFSGAFR